MLAHEISPQHKNMRLRYVRLPWLNIYIQHPTILFKTSIFFFFNYWVIQTLKWNRHTGGRGVCACRGVYILWYDKHWYCFLFLFQQLFSVLVWWKWEGESLLPPRLLTVNDQSVRGTLRRKLLRLLYHQTTRLSFLASPSLVGLVQRLPELAWVRSREEVARWGGKTQNPF